MTAATRDGVGAMTPEERDPLLRVGMLVGAATAGSGLALMVAPRVALWALGAKQSDPAPFLFRVVGMFMTVSGGSMFDVCRSPQPSTVGLRWALINKIGAAAMVTTGVRSGRFGKQAFVVAAIDGVSAGLLAAILRRR